MEDVAMRIMDMDFTPLSRSTIGFDRLIDLLENSLQGMPGSNYPPYNIEKTGEDRYRVTLAVAGFVPEDLSITTQANKLTVTGRKADAENVEYLYQGIAGRSFQREFSLADYVKVNGANLDKGLLTIDLMREVPDAMKPRRIVIGNGSKAIQIESQVAA
jgi:molecular chaperone IbpA